MLHGIYSEIGIGRPLGARGAVMADRVSALTKVCVSMIALSSSQDRWSLSDVSKQVH